jgi:hypothetical protein
MPTWIDDVFRRGEELETIGNTLQALDLYYSAAIMAARDGEIKATLELQFAARRCLQAMQ